jgi:hypothetical protein
VSQTKLVDEPIKVKKRDTSNTEFNRQKRELRSWYKKWKVGMVKWEDIPLDQQELLRRYYGVEDA